MPDTSSAGVSLCEIQSAIEGELKVAIVSEVPGIISHHHSLPTLQVEVGHLIDEISLSLHKVSCKDQLKGSCLGNVT